MHAKLAVCQCGDDSTQSYSTPCLLQSQLGHDQCSSRSVCMHGVSVQQSWHGATYFATYNLKAAACHYAHSRACNQSNRGIRLVTIQSRPSDRMLAALVPPGLGHQPVPTSRAQECHIYQSGSIPPLQHTTFLSEIYHLFWLWKVVYSQIAAYTTKKMAS